MQSLTTADYLRVLSIALLATTTLCCQAGFKVSGIAAEQVLQPGAIAEISWHHANPAFTCASCVRIDLVMTTTTAAVPNSRNSTTLREIISVATKDRGLMKWKVPEEDGSISHHRRNGQWLFLKVHKGSDDDCEAGFSHRFWIARKAGTSKSIAKRIEPVVHKSKATAVKLFTPTTAAVDYLLQQQQQVQQQPMEETRREGEDELNEEKVWQELLTLISSAELTADDWGKIFEKIQTEEEATATTEETTKTALKLTNKTVLDVSRRERTAVTCCYMKANSLICEGKTQRECRELKEEESKQQQQQKQQQSSSATALGKIKEQQQRQQQQQQQKQQQVEESSSSLLLMILEIFSVCFVGAWIGALIYLLFRAASQSTRKMEKQTRKSRSQPPSPILSSFSAENDIPLPRVASLPSVTTTVTSSSTTPDDIPAMRGLHCVIMNTTLSGNQLFNRKLRKPLLANERSPTYESELQQQQRYLNPIQKSILRHIVERSNSSNSEAMAEEQQQHDEMEENRQVEDKEEAEEMPEEYLLMTESCCAEPASPQEEIEEAAVQEQIAATVEVTTTATETTETETEEAMPSVCTTESITQPEETEGVIPPTTAATEPTTTTTDAPHGVLLVVRLRHHPQFNEDLQFVVRLPAASDVRPSVHTYSSTNSDNNQ